MQSHPHIRFLPGICLSLLLSLLWLPAHGSNLPRPAGLEPAIQFWKQVYTRIDSRQGYIHDDEHLDIIYTTVDLPASASRKRDRRIIRQQINAYRKLLTKLSQGAQQNLAPEEQRVLDIWRQRGAQPSELAAAARRLRFQRGQSDRFRQGLVRSGRWKDYIVRVFQEEGVPVELAALPHVESSFHPGARSHVGASGLWQFTRSTGRRFMRVDHVIDERLDPHKATVAAARLLKHNYGVTHSWPLAITAYNHGVSGMRRAQRQLGTSDIETIIRRYKGRTFGFASRNFYAAFLAALEVSRNSEKYFGPVPKDRPAQFVEARLPAYTTPEAVSHALGLSRDTLRRANPDLREPVWNGNKYLPKGYPLKLTSGISAAEAIARLAGIPGAQRYPRQKPDLEYRIQRGDSLSRIASRFNTTVAELVALNPLRSPHRIRAGQVLRLPVKDQQGTATVIAGHLHTVHKGETLGQIAQRLGTQPKLLLAMNDLADADRIYPGQQLRITSDVATGAKPAAAQPTINPPADSPLPATEPATEPAQSLVASEDEAQVSMDAAPTLDTELLADPSDYAVASDNSIEVQADETLGHYAEWLHLRASELRKLNRLSFKKPVIVGKRLKLVFRAADKAAFEQQRRAYHRSLQAGYFSEYRLVGSCRHTLRRGDSLWRLARQEYHVPMWLLRQYNPDIDFDTTLPPGTSLEIPRVFKRAAESRPDAPVPAASTLAC